MTNKLKKIIFRVDSSNIIGSGHVMRCLVFANKLQSYGFEIVFVCQLRESHLLEYIRSKGFKTVELSDTMDWKIDAFETIDFIKLKKEIVDWIIVDHYALDYKWEKELRPYVNNIMVIDDLANRVHECDLLLDQNYFHNMSERYKKYVQSSTTLLLGPQYLLLRDEFIHAHENLKEKQTNIDNIFIFFGGSDMQNFTVKALNCIIKLNRKALIVNVAIGNQNPYKKEILDICKPFPNIILHVQTENIANLMAQADIAVGSGGIATFERLYLKLPSLVITLAENQKEPLEAMAEKQWIELFSDEEDLFIKLNRVLQQGVVPVSAPVESGIEKICTIMKSVGIHLNKVSSLDIRRTFFWLQDLELLNDFMMKDRPIQKEHFIYWQNIICDSSQIVRSIYYKDNHVGNCGFKNYSTKDEKAEIWIYIAEKSYRFKGLAKSALILMINDFFFNNPKGTLYLHVNNSNKQAISLYKALSFVIFEEKKSDDWKSYDNIIYMELKK